MVKSDGNAVAPADLDAFEDRMGTVVYVTRSGAYLDIKTTYFGFLPSDQVSVNAGDEVLVRSVCVDEEQNGITLARSPPL